MNPQMILTTIVLPLIQNILNSTDPGKLGGTKFTSFFGGRKMAIGLALILAGGVLGLVFPNNPTFTPEFNQNLIIFGVIGIFGGNVVDHITAAYKTGVVSNEVTSLVPKLVADLKGMELEGVIKTKSTTLSIPPMLNPNTLHPASIEDDELTILKESDTIIDKQSLLTK
jgi:hypothetical protein